VYALGRLRCGTKVACHHARSWHFLLKFAVQHCNLPDAVRHGFAWKRRDREASVVFEKCGVGDLEGIFS
jgi:hypothetical protein